MVILEVFTKTITIKYKTTLLSKATFLAVLSALIRVVLPFIIAYNTGGFWLKEDIYYEQPKIKVIGDYLLIAVTNNSSNPVICSTYPHFRKYLKDLDLCSYIKLREVDRNFDAKYDELEIEININIYNFKMSSISLVLPIKYELSNVCPLTMQSLVYYQHYFQEKEVTELKVFAHLNLYQSSAILCRNKFAELLNNPIITNGQDNQHFAIENIIENYLKRNVTTHLTNVYTIIKKENEKIFKLKLNVKYPEHKIYYRPDVWHILKAAWIQYFAIYIIIAWISQNINRYIFRHKLVWYYEEYPHKLK